MKVSIISVFPDLYGPFLRTSLIHRAQENGLVTVDVAGFFSYVSPKERIDAPTFGHGAGMLIKPEVVERAIEDKQALHGKALKVFFSPQGQMLSQPLLKSLIDQAQRVGHIMMVPARYEGMDARVEQAYADITISVGNFVLMGGDIPAMMTLEGLLRLIPGVVGKQASVEHESFSGAFVDYPEYTEPVVWKDLEVPAVIRSGNHAQMHDWRMQQAAKKTVMEHFDWVKSRPTTPKERALVYSHIPHHYTALLHSDVYIGDEKNVGTTSVTSIDIHDISRSSKTYGLKGLFIVTPLVDQQRVVQVLLDFWQKGVGIEYNRQRHEAVKHARIESTLDDVVARIHELEGCKPVIVATSARMVDHPNHITFFDQRKVWASGRPVLCIFGTGRGLTDECIAKCDFVLPPLEGFTEFNHLSVRSAAAIVFDRWLGINIKNE